MNALLFSLAAPASFAPFCAADSLQIYVIDVVGGGSTLVNCSLRAIDADRRGQRRRPEIRNASPPPCAMQI
jgi:hypothetical protein